MADSIPSLRIANQKLRDENAELKRQLLSHEPRVIERVVQVEGPERVVERDREVPGPERVVFVDREVLVPFTEQIPQYPPSVEVIEAVREIYVTDPALEATIKVLQERLCQFTSQ